MLAIFLCKSELICFRLGWMPAVGVARDQCSGVLDGTGGLAWLAAWETSYGDLETNPI
jgi:hypothetical protein